MSNLGNVKSLEYVDTINDYKKNRIYKRKKKECILKPFSSKIGYLEVTLVKNKKRKSVKIHRIVAMTFLEKVKEKNYVNHIDGNKQNNNVENLEWCTQEQNVQHAIKNKLFDPQKCGQAKKPNNSRAVLQFDKNGNFIKEWKSIIDAERELEYKKSHISQCCKGKIKTSHGYIWRYRDE